MAKNKTHLTLLITFVSHAETPEFRGELDVMSVQMWLRCPYLKLANIRYQKVSSNKRFSVYMQATRSDLCQMSVENKRTQNCERNRTDSGKTCEVTTVILGFAPSGSVKSEFLKSWGTSSVAERGVSANLHSSPVCVCVCGATVAVLQDVTSWTSPL